ncbi:MAG: Na+/H+ antiporter [Pseudonocardiaceae bacterium]
MATLKASVEAVLFLVIVATVVATFARRLRVPAPSLLVIAGVVVGLLPGVPAIVVTPDVVSLVVLPPLLFAAGEELPWRDLREVWRPVTALAVGLVGVSAATVGALAIALTPLPVGMAFVLGAVLASTDPVAVAALARRLSLPPLVQALVQAESLFNDATSLLLFRVALSVTIAGGVVSWGHTLAEFAILAGGGVAVGAVIAGGAFLIRRRTEDPVLETVVALVTPYGAYVLAESIHASGVTAVVVASVILGTQATRLTNARIRLQLSAVFQTVVFLLESVVFGLIGLQLPALLRGQASIDTRWPLQALAIAATLMVVRVAWVFPLAAIRQRRNGAEQSFWRVPAVVSWAGTRGVVPLAAALSIPLTTSGPLTTRGAVTTSGAAALPDRDLVLLLSTAVIVITLVVQGFTLAPLVRRAGIALAPDDVAEEHTAARLALARVGLSYLEHLTDTQAAPEFVLEALRTSWQDRIERIKEHRDTEPSRAASMYRQLRRELLDVESAELDRLYHDNAITDATRRRIQRSLDLEHTGLSEGPEAP